MTRIVGGDLAELRVEEDGVHVQCALCRRDLGVVWLLCDAVRLWEAHREEESAKDKARAARADRAAVWARLFGQERS